MKIKTTKTIGIVIAQLLLLKSINCLSQDLSRLNLSVNPPSVVVFIDKKRIGVVENKQVIVVSSGNHTISASKNDYEPFTKKIICIPNQLINVDIILQPITTALIELESTTPGLIVNTYDSPSFSAPCNFKLEMGLKHFKFSANGMVPLETDLQVLANKKYKLEVNLLPSEKLPKVQASDIYRKYKEKLPYKDSSTLNDLRKKETEYRFNKDHGDFWASVLGIGFLVSMIKQHGGAAAISLLITGLAYIADVKEYPINENLAFNKKLEEDLTKENNEIRMKNYNIDSYNSDTKLLIEKKIKEQYISYAVKYSISE